MARVVLFGRGLSARLAHFYISHDSDDTVVAFTVDREHMGEGALEGLPVVPFDEVTERYPPEDHRMFVALGYGKVNRFRAERFEDAQRLGYELISYVSSRASVWPGVEIGRNCMIMEDTTLQPFASIGDDVTIWSAGHVGPGATIGDHAFLSSHAVVCREASIGARSFLGVNCTITGSVAVGEDNIIGAGAIIEADTRPREVFSPAKTIRLPVTSDRVPAV